MAAEDRDTVERGRWALGLVEAAQATPNRTRVTAAVDAVRVVLAALPAGDEMRTFWHVQLAELHLEMAGGTGEPETALAEQQAQAAVYASAPGSEDSVMALRTFWLIQQKAAERAHGVSDPAPMYALSRQILAGPTANDLKTVLAAATREALAARYARDGDVGHLGAGIEVAQTMAQLIDDPEEKATWLAGVVVDLQTRGVHLGSVDDLDRAVRIATDLLSYRHDDELPAMAWSEVSSALNARYRLTGEASDLDKAIRAAREALTAGKDFEWRWKVEQNLAGMLVTRYDKYGSDDDLQEAARIGQATVVPGSAEAAQALTSSVDVALTGALRRPSPAVFDAAIALARSALEAGRRFRDVEPQALQALAMTLTVKYQVDHELGAQPDARRRRARRRDLDEAVRLAERAVSLTPRDHTAFRKRVMCLSQAHEVRFKYRGRRQDIDRCVDLLTALCGAPPVGEDQDLDAATELGLILRLRFTAYGAPDDARSAAAYLRNAASTPRSGTMKLIAALSWAQLEAATDPASAASRQAHTTAMEAVEELAWVGGSTADLFRRMGSWPSVGPDAAACLLAADQPLAALDTLERGRSTVWRALASHRVDLASVERVAPVLAVRMAEAMDQLRKYYSGEWAATVDERVRLSHRWRALVEEAREAGADLTSGALDPESLSSGLGDDAAIVAVNVSAVRSDAIVVRRDSFTVVPLPALRAADAHRFLLALQEAYHGTSRSWVARPVSRTVTGVLEWLWDVMAEPISVELDRTGTARIWWCPTGPLALLPLHAATRRSGRGRPTAYLADRYVMSYLPDLRSFSRPPCGPPDLDAALVVGVPESTVDGASALPSVRDEVAVVEAALTGARKRVGPEATGDTVLRELATASVVHLSCHGTVDLEDPASSGLVLHDRVVTLGELARLDNGGYLAFLSACDTGSSSADHANESANLIGALQYVGWQHVIGSLAPVEDAVAASVAAHFYHRLRQRPEEPVAVLLDEAVGEVRRRLPDRPDLWAPFVHYGT